MKPRLRLRRRVWSCSAQDWMNTGIVGYGYTPKEAYADWAERVRRDVCGRFG